MSIDFLNWKHILCIFVHIPNQADSDFWPSLLGFKNFCAQLNVHSKEACEIYMFIYFLSQVLFSGFKYLDIGNAFVTCLPSTCQ